MLRYIQIRLLISIPVILGVATAAFLMLYSLPGDPVMAMLAQSGAPAETVARLREQLRLDDPGYVQYGRYMWSLAHGDLGRSVLSNVPVLDLILEQLPSTLQLAGAAMLIATVMGVSLGTLSALRPNSWLDDLSMLLALLGVSMPSFWFGLLLIFFFSLRLGWLPATGAGGWERLIMPAFVLGFGSAAVIARMVRSGLLEVLAQDYIRTARSKGLIERAVIMRHALKNALIPAVTMIGLQFGFMLGGSVITETVFSRPGVGRLAITAILNKDFTVVQGTVLFIAVMYVVVNLLVDLSYAYLDPRIHHE
ncbi:MAG: ABC transporter permease [Chloroflexi bacterium]|nr:ABC transporter permease [Chloroflexota bacterium]MCL5074324.1 ABC transporter permease [Chloroflexota bacterium]